MIVLGFLLGGGLGVLTQVLSHWAFRRLPQQGAGAVGWVAVLFLVRLGVDALGLYLFFRWGGESFLIGAAAGLVLVLFAGLWRDKAALERSMRVS